MSFPIMISTEDVHLESVLLNDYKKTYCEVVSSFIDQSTAIITVYMLGINR